MRRRSTLIAVALAAGFAMTGIGPPTASAEGTGLDLTASTPCGSYAARLATHASDEHARVATSQTAAHDESAGLGSPPVLALPVKGDGGTEIIRVAKEGGAPREGDGG